jgi:hypothetical protein
VPTLDLQARIDALPPPVRDGLAITGGDTIHIPPGTWDVPGTVTVPSYVKLLGAGGTFGQGGASHLLFPDGTDACLVLPPGSQAQVIEGLVIRPQRGAACNCGILVRSHAPLIAQVSVHGMRRDGIFINANLDVGGNANGWMISKARLQKNGRDGLRIDGGETNAGLALEVDANENGEWGIHDSSFLGNTFVACHTKGNGNHEEWSRNPEGVTPIGGSYAVDGLSAYSLFLGCYQEDGQHPPAIRNTNTLVVGNNLCGATTPPNRIGLGNSRLTFRGPTSDPRETLSATILQSAHDSLASWRDTRDAEEFWLLSRRRSGNPAWLADTLELVRRGATWQVPIAFTSEGHRAGPMCRAYGMPFVDTPFRFQVLKLHRFARDDTWETIDVRDSRFSVPIPGGVARRGEHCIRLTVELPGAAAAPIILGGYHLDIATNTLRVQARTEGARDPEGYKLLVDVERRAPPDP